MLDIGFWCVITSTFHRHSVVSTITQKLLNW